MNDDDDDDRDELRRRRDEELAEHVAALLTDERRANRERWLVALESGDYAQTTKLLRRQLTDVPTFGYCCLGVAEHVRIDGDWHVRIDGDDLLYVPNDNRSESGVLTAHGRDWLGVASSDPLVAVDLDGIRTLTTLTTLNDRYRVPLPQVAAVIRGQESDWIGTHEQAVRLVDERRHVSLPSVNQGATSA